MTLQQQQEHFEQFAEKMAKTMLSKGNDYAGQERLANFRLVALIAQIPVEKVFMVMLATKVVRLGNLTNGGTPNCESIEDSLLDNTNYSVLFDAWLNEMK